MPVIAADADVLFVIRDRYGHEESGVFAIAAARLNPGWQVAIISDPESRYRIPLHAVCLTEDGDDPVVFDAEGFRKLSDVLPEHGVQTQDPMSYVEKVDEPTAFKRLTFGDAGAPRILRELRQASTAVQTLMELSVDARRPTIAA